MDDVIVRSGCAIVPAVPALLDLSVWPLPTSQVVLCRLLQVEPLWTMSALGQAVPLCQTFQRFQICLCGECQCIKLHYANLSVVPL